jgi:glycosyltransferase involved in cell wall biosynthesis
MKILYAWSKKDCASTRMNTFQVKEGFDRIGHPIQIKEAFNLTQDDFNEFDVILLQRIGGKRESWISDSYVAAIREYKKKGSAVLLYHLDDLLCYTILRDIVSFCDGMLVPQEIYPRYFGDVCKKFYKIDTFVDLKEVYQIIPSNDIYDFNYDASTSKINLVWASTAGLGYDFICDVIQELNKRDINYRLFTMGLSEPKKLKGAVHLGMLQYDEMISVVKACNVLLNPISTPKDTLYGVPAKDFIDGKSAVKYVIAGACHVPIISSRSDPYSKAITHGVNGFLLNNNPVDWARAIKKLQDLPFNMRMAHLAQRDVAEKFSLEKACLHLLNIFKKAASKSPL